jgi:hypothetical protein
LKIYIGKHSFKTSWILSKIRGEVAFEPSGVRKRKTPS